MNKKEKGGIGEKIAEDYLRKNKYKILQKNYTPQFISGPRVGEIDIVAEKKGVISFVEVKSSFSKSPFPPEDRVNLRKKRKLVRTAEQYLFENHYPTSQKWQIDVIAIEKEIYSQEPTLRHFKNVVSKQDI